MNRIQITAARLNIEESRKSFAYNDATGKRITCRPEGNLSIAVGLNLETGLDNEEMDWLLSHRIGKTDTLLRKFEWYADLDEPRGSVFLDVGYNAGVAGLLGFTSTIHYASIKAWNACSSALLNSKAARRLPTRYKALANIIQTGFA